MVRYFRLFAASTIARSGAIAARKVLSTYSTNKDLAWADEYEKANRDQVTLARMALGFFGRFW